MGLMYVVLLLASLTPSLAAEDCAGGVSFLQTKLERASKACPRPDAMRGSFAQQLSGFESSSESERRAVETCGMLSQCVDTTDSAKQDAWAKVNAIDALSYKAF